MQWNINKLLDQLLAKDNQQGRQHIDRTRLKWEKELGEVIKPIHWKQFWRTKTHWSEASKHFYYRYIHRSVNIQDYYSPNQQYKWCNSHPPSNILPTELFKNQLAEIFTVLDKYTSGFVAQWQQKLTDILTTKKLNNYIQDRQRRHAFYNIYQQIQPSQHLTSNQNYILSFDGGSRVTLVEVQSTRLYGTNRIQHGYQYGGRQLS